MTDFVSVSAGSAHTLVLRADGTVWAWGQNNNGQLGNGKNSSSFSMPAEIPGFTLFTEGIEFRFSPDYRDIEIPNLGENIVTISARVFDASGREIPNADIYLKYSVAEEYSGLSIDEDTGAVAVTHEALPGIAKLKATYFSRTAIMDMTVKETVDKGQDLSNTIAARGSSTVVLANDGTVWTFGINNNGQLGNGTTINSAIPVQISNLTNIECVSAGSEHNLALNADGTVWSWGYNATGQLGDGTKTNRSIPVQVKNLTNIIAIKAGRISSMALKADGTVWAWGGNDYGILGDGTTTFRTEPVQVSGLTDVIAIALGDYHSLALNADGTVWAWGANTYGQLGDGTTTNRNKPVMINGITNVISIAAGNNFSLLLKNTGTISAWGLNGKGQLGNGTLNRKGYPVQIENLTNIVSISVGGDFCIALERNGKVWAWGNNSNGQLGDGTVEDKTVPKQVQGIYGIGAVAAGSSHSVALKTDGTIWVWGKNDSGQLGDDVKSNRTIPSQVDGIPLVGVVSPTDTKDDEDIESVIRELSIDEIPITETLIHRGITDNTGKTWLAIKPRASSEYEINVSADEIDSEITVYNSDLITVMPNDGRYAFTGGETYYVCVKFINGTYDTKYTCEINAYIFSLADYWNYYGQLTDESLEYWHLFSPEVDGSYNLLVESQDDAIVAEILDEELTPLTPDADGNLMLLSEKTYYISLKLNDDNIDDLSYIITLQMVDEPDDESLLDIELPSDDDLDFEFDKPNEEPDDGNTYIEAEEESEDKYYDDGSSGYEYSDEPDSGWTNNHIWVDGPPSDDDYLNGEIQDDSEETEESEIESFSRVMSAGEISVLAASARIVYTFDPNGANASTKYFNCASSSHIHTIGRKFVRPGYLQIGWSLSPGGPVYTFSYKHQFSSSVTLYAVWEPIPFEVLYYGNKANSGKVPPKQKTGAVNKAVIISDQNTLQKRDLRLLVGILNQMEQAHHIMLA